MDGATRWARCLRGRREPVFIRQVISYGGAWQRLRTDFQQPLASIDAVISQLDIARIAAQTRIEHGVQIRPYRQLDLAWQELMQGENWLRPRLTHGRGRGRISLSRLHFIKDRVSASLIQARVGVNPWLYTAGPIAVRFGYIDIPVAVMPTGEAYRVLREAGGMAIFPDDSFENLRSELLALSPLSHGAPFVLLGVSFENGALEETQLEREAAVEFRQIVVDRAIEFPPQYHQAGLGILNYFGAVLRDKYPDQNAKVRIEQDGLKVRLIVESENGSREVIEQALHEYGLVLRGEIPPEAFVSSRFKVLELKNEIRLLNARIETQKELMQVQNEHVRALHSIVAQALGREPGPIIINASPQIAVNQNQILDVRATLPEIVGELGELCEAVDDAPTRTKLLDLQEAVEIASSEPAPDKLRSSSALRKLRDFLEEATTAGTKAHELLIKVEGGVNAAQSLGESTMRWLNGVARPKSLEHF